MSVTGAAEFGEAGEEGGEFGEADGFRQNFVQAGGEKGLAAVGEGVGGDGDDAGLAGGGELGAERAGGGGAVHPGHLDIHEHEIEGRGAEGGEGREAVGRVGGEVAEFLEHAAENFLVNGIVLGDKDPGGMAGGELGVEFGRRECRRGRCGEACGRRAGEDREMENGSDAGSAFGPQFAALQFGEVAADDEAEAAAAEGAGGGAIGLFEALEEVGRRAAGIPIPVSQTRKVSSLEPSG